MSTQGFSKYFTNGPGSQTATNDDGMQLHLYQRKTRCRCFSHKYEPRVADQSRSKLMTIPRELRDIIYGYVYDYNPKKETKSKGRDINHDDRVSSLPDRIPLERTAPPSKDAIMPCRELYLEMRRMQIAAYRRYWTNNRFTFSFAGDATYNRWLCTQGQCPSTQALQDLSHVDRFAAPPQGSRIFSMLPSTQDLRHIRHFSALYHDLDVFDVVFELGKWHTKARSSIGDLLRPGDEGYDQWQRIQHELELMFQRKLQNAAKHLERKGGFDPRRGKGLHGGILIFLAHRRYCDLMQFLRPYVPAVREEQPALVWWT